MLRHHENKYSAYKMKSGAIDYFTSEILSARASENKYIRALVKSLNIL